MGGGIAIPSPGQERPPHGGTDASDCGGPAGLTPRGFTSHEMPDDLGLVHMNGRIYDPLLGRFLSADILVQRPGDLQAYNRYSYVWNNPLSYTDPTGNVVLVDDVAIGAVFVTVMAVAYVESPQGQQQVKAASDAIVTGVTKASDAVIGVST